MMDEYDSDARKLYLQPQLEILALQSFMANRDILDEASGSTKSVKETSSFTPQFLPEFCSDSEKVRFFGTLSYCNLRWKKPLEMLLQQG